jgi:hypothetical protein
MSGLLTIPAMAMLLQSEPNPEAAAATAAGAAAAGVGMGMMLLYLALIVVCVIGMWKAFEKAGHPGWSAIIPIYNVYILLQIVGRPVWWLVLFILPCINFVVIIIVSLDVAKKFGKSPLFGVGLALLGPIFWPILGFGDAQYQR